MRSGAGISDLAPLFVPAASDGRGPVRQLERIRHDLVGQRTHLSNRIRALLDTYKIPPPQGSLYRPSALAALRKLRLPVSDLDACVEALALGLNAARRSRDQTV